MRPNHQILFDSTSLLLLALMAAIAAVVPCFAAIASMGTANTTTKQGCPRQCGNITIPYPFGIGLDSGCSLNYFYDVFCNRSSYPPKPYLFGWSEGNGDVAGIVRKNVFEILGISETQIRIRNPYVAVTCFNDSNSVQNFHLTDIELAYGSPFSFSSTSNKLVVIGCHQTGGGYAFCRSECSSKDSVVAGQCDGFGCCQAAVAPGGTSIDVYLAPHSNYTNVVSFNPCGYAFLAEEGWFTFGGLSDLNDPNFPRRVMDAVPVVIDWFIGNRPCAEAQTNPTAAYRHCVDAQRNPYTYVTCAEAKRNLSTYACMGNTTCTDHQSESGIGGYRCTCLSGFQGNPYLYPGCSDIDECADPILSNCSMECHNIEGSFHCLCPAGYTGDGQKSGSGCRKQSSQDFLLKICLGIISAFLLSIAGIIWLYYIVDRKRKIIKMKKKFFQQNGGWLLKEQLSMTNFGNIEPTNIYTEEELKTSTNNFDKDCIVGSGGNGTVYKGILLDNRVVAIKKSKLVDQNQIEQFINELVILGQINHRNVVKLLGCCLETEVPLLVYEFISKGTLYNHIYESQNEGERWRLKWVDCLRIASEVADALAYLHSAASPPIIHRDIKSMNILLNDDYTAKIADFGASRLIPMDQSKLPTLVQGTLGYLDPEYLHSSLLTEKSDVYSFGVVLAELLTRQKPFDAFRPEEHRNLATYFLRSVEKEKLFDIVDPQWLNEASTSELVSIASITQRCLQLNGRDRPTMREVSIELEATMKHKKQVKINQLHEETKITMPLHSSYTNKTYNSMLQDEETDLYPILKGTTTNTLFQ